MGLKEHQKKATSFAGGGGGGGGLVLTHTISKPVWWLPLLSEMLLDFIPELDPGVQQCDTKPSVCAFKKHPYPRRKGDKPSNDKTAMVQPNKVDIMSDTLSGAPLSCMCKTLGSHFMLNALRSLVPGILSNTVKSETGGTCGWADP